MNEGIRISVTINLPSNQFVSGKEVREEEKLIERNKSLPKEKREKLDLKYHTIKFIIIGEGKNEFTIPVFEKKRKVSQQIINMYEEAYKSFTKDIVPIDFKAPFNFDKNPRINKSRAQQAWDIMSKYDRIKWHLHRLADDLGGKLNSFTLSD